jgi:4,5-dihydroxyphthalate decarboxylase
MTDVADELSLAIDRNDRTLALHLALVEPPDGVRVEYVPQSGPRGRHERMLRDGEWDICELSLSSYILARTHGYPLTAIPVFPRRMFTVGLIFVRAGSGLDSPKELVSRRMGIRTFQTSLCIWGLGDLATVYGVDLARIEWVTEAEEGVPLEPPSAWRWTRIPEGDSLDEALDRGQIDALIVPRMPRAGIEEGRVVRLFPAEEPRRYFNATGVFPIMHTIAAKREVLERRPALAGELVECFERAKRAGYEFYSDPNWSHLAGSRRLFDEERAWLGRDPYPYGLEANLPALRRLIDYQQLCGLLSEPVTPEDLFAPVEP